MRLSLELEEDCGSCEGIGHIYNLKGKKKVPCVACQGRRKQLTYEGRELLDFIRRWLEQEGKTDAS